MIRIHAERDSVCMGDDVLAPNADDFCFPGDVPVDDLMQKLCGYVPQMRNVVWEIVCGRQTIGYLYSGENGEYQYETAGKKLNISQLPSRSIYCRYYYDRKGCPENLTLVEWIRASKQKMQSSG